MSTPDPLLQAHQLRHQFLDVVALYQVDQGGQVSLVLVPTELEGRIATRRANLAMEFAVRRMDPAWASSIPAIRPEPLVPIKLAGDMGSSGFPAGKTLHHATTHDTLKYRDQRVERTGDTTTVITTLHDPARGLVVEHHLRHTGDDPALRAWSVACNQGSAPFELELLGSTSLDGLTPFAVDDAPGRLRIHRWRTGWSNEARPVCDTAEHLGLEPSWTSHGLRCERFGQVGSMPVNHWHPQVVVEDAAVGCCWGLQVCWGGSWQIELVRRGDHLALSGGLADRELGHWVKRLEPGDAVTSPEVRVTTVAGDLDACCQRLMRLQEPAAAAGAPPADQDLPVIFNDWCTFWGNPDPARIDAITKRLAGTLARYYIIDAGWYKEEGTSWFQSHGDWQPSKTCFPQGIKAMAEVIRANGLIPGLWFEPETCGSESREWRDGGERHLKLGGHPIAAGNRRFLDLRQSETRQLLEQRVIDLLDQNGFGYTKIDYNESIGLGCDGAESPGEGLRQHLEGVRAFYARMRERMPHLTVEFCSSGGHRLEPWCLGQVAMGSFSDAHETLEIPLIAAELSRLMLPRQSQIWATLRADDDERRLRYSLAAGFYGRLCLSGDVDRLSTDQWRIAQDAMALYARCAETIRTGASRMIGHTGPSQRHPSGWKGVIRQRRDGRELLVVVHTYGADPAAPIPGELTIPMPRGDWQIAEAFAIPGASARLDRDSLQLPTAGEWTGTVLRLERR